MVASRNFPKSYRPTPGPCLFCQRSDVRFTKEHLPPESLVGGKAIELVDWVCAQCNSDFKEEEHFFGNNYHGAVFRSIRGVVGKKNRGAEVVRKDIWVKYQPATATVQMHFKRMPKFGELGLLPSQAAWDYFQQTGKITIGLEESREVNPRRLERCLAKMALETVAYLKPDAVQRPELETIRLYARRQRGLRFLPYAVGVSEISPGVKLYERMSADETRYVMVAVIYLPSCGYAIQLSDHHDLTLLRYVAQCHKMGLDEDGRGKKVNILLTLEWPDRMEKESSGETI